MNLNRMAEKYLDYCQYRKELNFKTLKAYQIDLNQFIDLVKGEEDPFSKMALDTYLTSIHKQYAPKTTKRKVASVKAFFHYLEYEEMLEENPFNKMEVRFQEPQCLPKTVPLQTVEILMKNMYLSRGNDNTELQRKQSLRDVTVIELLFCTGLRISELCTLRPEQVDLANHIILIQGKGNKQRMMQICNPEVSALLDRYFEAYQTDIEQSGWVFINRLHQRLSEQSVRLIIQKYCKQADIQQHITPHMLRHTFATLLLEEDVDIRYIQHMLGHSSITTTEIYTQVSMSKQRNILKSKHPRNHLHMHFE